MSDDTAVTGKPMEHYEPYVEMLSHVLANGLALSTEHAFLLGLDRSVPLHEAVRDAARDSIRWRFAFEIDRIEAARAEVSSGVVAEEPEWEYGYDSIADAEAERPTTRRRKAGPWVPVKQEGESHG